MNRWKRGKKIKFLKSGWKGIGMGWVLFLGYVPGLREGGPQHHDTMPAHPCLALFW